MDIYEISKTVRMIGSLVWKFALHIYLYALIIVAWIFWVSVEPTLKDLVVENTDKSLSELWEIVRLKGFLVIGWVLAALLALNRLRKLTILEIEKANNKSQKKLPKIRSKLGTIGIVRPSHIRRRTK